MNEAIEKKQFELETRPYACFSVDAKGMTLESIQDLLCQAYLTRRANPQYVFVAEQDREIFAMPLDDYLGKLTKLVNQTTGRLMSIVTLPDMEPGKLLFGFFSY